MQIKQMRNYNHKTQSNFHNQKSTIFNSRKHSVHALYPLAQQLLFRRIATPCTIMINRFIQKKNLQLNAIRKKTIHQMSTFNYNTYTPVTFLFVLSLFSSNIDQILQYRLLSIFAFKSWYLLSNKLPCCLVFSLDLHSVVNALICGSIQRM